MELASRESVEPHSGMIKKKKEFGAGSFPIGQFF